MTAAAAAPEPLFTRSFASLMIAQAGFGYSFSSFFLLPKFLSTELGAGPVETGLVLGAYGPVAIPAILVMGAVVDRFGRRSFLTVGALLMALTALGFASVDEMSPLLYGLRGLQGLAFAMAFTAGGALAVDLAPPSRVAQAIGLFGVTFLSMNAIAAAVTEEVAARVGWHEAFAAAAVGAVLCAVLSRRVSDSRVRPAPEDATSLRNVALRPSQLRLAAVISLVGVGLGAAFTFHQLFAQQLQIPDVRSFFIAYAAAAVFVRVVLGHQVDRLGRRQVSLAALVLYAPVVAAMAKLDVLGLPLVGAGLGLAHGLLYPALNAVAIEISGEHERGKVMALFQAAFIVGFSGALPLLGIIAETRGYPDVFLVAGLSVFGGLVLLALSPEGRTR